MLYLFFYCFFGGTITKSAWKVGRAENHQQRLGE
ncbi:MAG: hypothetical protein ACD_80C00113G0001, partial [uncultured bacterium (gcode 4)]